MTWEDEVFQKRFQWGLWRRLAGYLRPYRGRFALLVLIMMTVGAVDAVFPFLTKVAVDAIMIKKSSAAFLPLALTYGALALIQATLVWTMIRIGGSIEQGLVYDLREAGMAKLQALSLSYYDRTPTGWILARLTSDANRLGETVSWGLVDMTWGASLMLAISVFLVVLEPRLGLITLAVVPPLVVASLYFQRQMIQWYRRVKKLGSEVSAAFSEGLQGARSTKVLRREAGNIAEFHDQAGRLRSSSIRAAYFSALYLPIVLVLGSIGTALALSFGTPMVAAGTLTVGTLVAFVSYSVFFFEPVRELARVLSELQQTQTSAERLLSLVETTPEIVDADDAVPPSGRLAGRVEFRDVSFWYVEGEPILEHFNLVVPAGQTVALVGETGSGKSTIVNLVCRFYEPRSGAVLIDDTDSREMTQRGLQSQLGYVLQTPQLFQGSIRENIRYGRLDASDAEVEAAAQAVNATPFIATLEDGFETLVGEGGNRLSTGQKQLVSLARAVLADPVLFILDEATSSVDTETERLIQVAVERVLKGRTSFVIAHRLSTIVGADRILVLEHGVILEDGTHDELMRRRGRYFALYTSQFLDEQERQVVDRGSGSAGVISAD